MNANCNFHQPMRGDARRYPDAMTLADVAEYLNMHLTVYRRYEKGEREIPVWAVIKLAEYYKTTTDYILGLSDQR